MNAVPFGLGAVPVPRTWAVADERPLRVEPIVDLTAFAALRDEWSDLLADSRSASVFLSWEWLHTWWVHLAGARTLRLLAVRRGTELVGLAPLASTGRGLLGLERLEFLGGGQVGSDYLDLLARPGLEREVVRSLAGHLVAAGASLDLKQVRIVGSLARELVRALRGAGCRQLASRTQCCPVIDLRGRSWEGYLGSLGSEHRYGFQRKLRKAEARHALRFERVESEPRRRELLPVLFDLHVRRWRERGGSDGLEGAGLLEFHEEFTRLALERGWLRLFVLWLDGAPAAALYGFRYGHVFSFYQSGLEPRCGKLGAGVLALGLAIRSAILEGASEFDLLHGREAYKFHWARRVRRLGRLRAFPRGARGRLAWHADSARDALRQVLRRQAGGGSRAAAPR